MHNFSVFAISCLAVLQVTSCIPVSSIELKVSVTQKQLFDNSSSISTAVSLFQTQATSKCEVGQCSMPSKDSSGGYGLCSSNGVCQSSSCISNGIGQSERNCPNGKNCPWDKFSVACKKLVPTCFGPHCWGFTHCLIGSCPASAVNVFCVFDGASFNFKVCGCDAGGGPPFVADCSN
jgi:hypothetical protein